MRVDGISGTSQESKVNFIGVMVRGRYSSNRTLKNVRSIPNLGLSIQSVVVDAVKSFDYLSDTRVLCYENAKPMLMIGIDWLHGLSPSPYTSWNPCTASSILNRIWLGHVQVFKMQIQTLITVCSTSALRPTTLKVSPQVLTHSFKNIFGYTIGISKK